MHKNINSNEDIIKNTSPLKSKKIDIIEESDEEIPNNNFYDIENKITAMLDKVMEEDEETETKTLATDFDSLQFAEEEENEENSFGKRRNVGKHQTSLPLSIEKLMFKKVFNDPSINRGNKRYQTVNCNQINNSQLNGNEISNNNQFLFQIPQGNINNFGCNMEISNCINLNNFAFNPQQQIQYSQLINNNQNANFIRSNFPAKTVVYKNNNNQFNDCFNINNNNNLTNNVYNNFNNTKNCNVCINPNVRNDKRKKTYDVTVYKYLVNNLVNNNNSNSNSNNNNNFMMKNINTPDFNNQLFGFNNISGQQNNIMINNNNYSNLINQLKPINNNVITDDSKIMELKLMLEKSGKIDHYIYNNIKGKILSILKNHKGSRIFQKYLKSTHCDILHQIYMELNYNLEELFTDPYANYFCKKFFTYLNQKDRVELLKGIEKSIVKLSSDSVGTFTIQTIIEHVGSKNEKSIIVSAIKDNIRQLSFDPFGSHVLEGLLTYFEEEYVSFIYNYVTDNFIELASDNNGIIVIKKILTLTHKKVLHDKIKNIVKENALTLIKHPYANLVIQVIVENWPDYKDILVMFEGKYFSLSLEKYASNVVERCLEKDQNILNKFIDEIVDSEKISEVMKSNFGNYVIQKAIKLAKNENKQKLVYNAAKDVNKLNDPKLIIKWKSILLSYFKDFDKEILN